MEIEFKLNLDFEQLKVLDHHSLLNILNVVVYELMVYSQHVGHEDAMEATLERVHATANAIAEGALEEGFLAELNRLKEDVLEAVQVAGSKAGILHEPDYAESYFNLKGVFEILEIRIKELKHRSEHPMAWEAFSCKFLSDDLVKMYEAFSRNSKGKYGFAFDEKLKTEHDYLVDLSFEGWHCDQIVMPPVFQDVIRDLAANSRKYTNLGGSLSIGVQQTETSLEIEIADTGIGIPSSEIPEIIRFGYRGSNARGKRTMGGGFGLTKAYYLVQMFGGRMWIDSRTEGQTGTTIRVVLPIPCQYRSLLETLVEQVHATCG